MTILLFHSSTVAVEGAEEESITGLEFGSNGGDDQRFHFTGADLINKFPATYLWKRTHVSQAGYYTNFFHGPNGGSLPTGNTYYGAHPFPCDGNFNGSGQATGGTGDAGTSHRYEVAGSFVDYIETEDGDAQLVTKDGVTFVSQALTVQATGDNDLTVTYYYALPSTSERIVVVLDDNRATEGTQALTYGGAPWNVELECFSGVLRGIQNFAAVLTTGQITDLEACDTNAEALSVASSNSLTHHYLNMNPTPDDITDKSGAGHDPAWANANRPTLWEQ